MRAAIIVTLAFSPMACGEKSASQEDLQSLETRVKMAEDDIEEIQKAVKYAKEVQEWEAAKKRRRGSARC